ncbi:unnamed protein product [Lepeophtheirus salmonis]|uniref:(salmon louse) hypothetical protein n=1 Tax=Lepeophtheirus salmonis TaxID=72036 RepID=A0A7R8H478_LEPSM|nr:unnamed protein product [Lepeophtheirus salmonis]CAF2852806.1 unnamed protein product [Lepeophtheirus salmonis]
MRAMETNRVLILHFLSFCLFQTCFGILSNTTCEDTDETYCQSSIGSDKESCFNAAFQYTCPKSCGACDAKCRDNNGACYRDGVDECFLSPYCKGMSEIVCRIIMGDLNISRESQKDAKGYGGSRNVMNRVNIEYVIAEYSLPDLGLQHNPVQPSHTFTGVARNKNRITSRLD